MGGVKDVYIDGEPESELGASFSQKLGRSLRWLLVVVVLLVISAVIFVYYNLSKLSVNPLDLRGLAETGGRTNILILGVGDPGHPGQNLSDTIMVLSINHSTHQVALISVPRDLRVAIPGKYTAKINAANVLGGPKLAEQTVADTLGIPINYYILTDFSGLRQAVDVVGGLDITVKDRLYDPEYPCANDQGTCGINILPGNYHMNGDMILQYTRCRKGTCGNDFGRAARQQAVIEKLEAKITQPKVFLNLGADAALLTTLRTYAKTDLSSNNLVSVGRDMKAASSPIQFVYSTAPGGLLKNSGGSDLVPAGGSYAAMQNVAQNIFTTTLPKPTN